MDLIVMLAMFGVATVAVFVLTGPSGKRMAREVPQKSRRNHTVRVVRPEVHPAGTPVAVLAVSRARTMQPRDSGRVVAGEDDDLEDRVTGVWRRAS